jgi:uncharacterized protein
MALRAIDVHSHFSTKEGILSTLKFTKQIAKHYSGKEVETEQLLKFAKTDEQMAQDFIDNRVKGILVGWDAETNTGEPPMSNDYVASMVTRFPEAFIGAYGCVDPHKGEAALVEAERCIKELGMMGLKFQSIAQGFFPNDPMCYPLWDLCQDLGVSIQLHQGATGMGAGMPGGGGLKLKYTRPIPYIDDVAADFPDLQITCLHPAVPWQEESIAMAIHKSNVNFDLSGYAPKYIPDILKKEIKGRLKDRVMFGSDYPIIPFDRLFTEWEAEGYGDEILEKIMYKNAIRILDLDITEAEFG